MTTCTPSSAFQELQHRRAPVLFFGIDPGIVHTAGVMLGIYPNSRALLMIPFVVDGIKPDELDKMIKWVNNNPTPDGVFIEKYRPRSNFQHDMDMIAGVDYLKRGCNHSEVLDNTGVVKVIRPNLLKLLNLWDFPQRTHHQDLRSAARIMLLGMLKDPEINEMMYHIVNDIQANASAWTIN